MSRICYNIIRLKEYPLTETEKMFMKEVVKMSNQDYDAVIKWIKNDSAKADSILAAGRIISSAYWQIQHCVYRQQPVWQQIRQPE